MNAKDAIDQLKAAKPGDILALGVKLAKMADTMQDRDKIISEAKRLNAPKPAAKPKGKAKSDGAKNV